MAQAVEAYHSVSATEEFRMLERMRQDMRSNEVTALNRARREGVQQGMQQGMQQILAFLSSGHSLEEAKKKFVFA